jgi:tRNA wybutosine-synthesizing protein 3
MAYEARKTNALNNLSAAEKTGDLDMPLKPLLEAINSRQGLYTTSSCMGRIILMREEAGKGSDRFLVKYHRKVGADELMEAMRRAHGTVWLRSEPPILHVICQTLDDARKIMHAALESGFKRSGIQSIRQERNLVEILSTERVDLPALIDGELMLSEEYVRRLTQIVNRKFDRGKEKIRRLTEKTLEI